MRCFKIVLALLLTLSCLGFTQEASSNESWKEIPVAFKGRFRPLEVATGAWFCDFYHQSSLKKCDRQTFELAEDTAAELAWKMEILGHEPWDGAPLFYLDSEDLKEALDLTEQRSYSYHQLHKAITTNPETNLEIVKPILTYHFIKKYRDASNRSGAEKLELTALAPGLWVSLKKDDLVVVAAPSTFPWHHLKPGLTIQENARTHLSGLERRTRPVADSALQLIGLMQPYEQLSGFTLSSEKAIEETVTLLQERQVSPDEIAQTTELHHPLNKRLAQAGFLKVVPGRYRDGEWFALKALKVKIYDPQTNRLVPVSNFTRYSDGQFEAIRSAYVSLEKELQANPRLDLNTSASMQELTTQLLKGYDPLAGTLFQESAGNSLRYPSWLQLDAEKIYARYPWLATTFVFYATSLFCFLFALTLNNQRLHRWALSLFSIAFIFHTTFIALRCLILSRPPVSNMFETVIYVPWIAVFISFFLAYFLKARAILAGAAAVATGLLFILYLTDLPDQLENVQAVLNSQYWLIVHVLMVVGSYGAFILSGVFGHLYLIAFAQHKEKKPFAQQVAKWILQTIYVGTALLIPGTILGGVWAAESWGRFWDWDPKESWAFISSCFYVIFIHAHRFHKIHDLGLAIGSVIGLQFIIFTWYGVNYILGTGLHSYGFGSGGEEFYYLFLAIEGFFLASIAAWRKKGRKLPV